MKLKLMQDLKQPIRIFCKNGFSKAFLSDAIQTVAFQFRIYEWTLFLESIEHCGVLFLLRFLCSIKQ